jgi:ABC-type dipeptide/oligopeptide/nickel transport system permease subunit
MKIALKVDDLPHVIMLALRLTGGIDIIDIIIANHYLRTVRNQPPNLRSLDFTHFAGLLCAKTMRIHTQEGISSAKAPVRLKIWSCLGILQEL